MAAKQWFTSWNNQEQINDPFFNQLGNNMQMTDMYWVKCSAVNTYSGQISLGLGEVLSKEVR
jgi:hypothetical protein